MNLEEYYNKFNEDKRLNTKRGQIEYMTSMKYIHNYLNKESKILDIGAGTGKYTIKLYEEGYDITALELVKHNLQVIKTKNRDIKSYQGNALNLSRFKDNEFDMVLLFGPMYHLKAYDEQVKALEEAKRVTKTNGIILVAYCMNEYAVITYGFKGGNIKDNSTNKQIDESFHITNKGNNLYNYVRIEDIDKINKEVGLKRIKIISVDGPSSYIKEYLNKMDNESFELFFKYHLATCERIDLIGASTHTLDILIKEK